LNVFQKVDTAFTVRHTVSAASSKTGIAGALQHHVLLFAAKMAADTNQLKELREFLRAGNEDLAKRLIQTLNSSRKASRKVEVEVAKGKYARIRVCLTMKTTDLKTFYASLHFKIK